MLVRKSFSALLNIKRIVIFNMQILDINSICLLLIFILHLLYSWSSVWLFDRSIDGTIFLHLLFKILFKIKQLSCAFVKPFFRSLLLQNLFVFCDAQLVSIGNLPCFEISNLSQFLILQILLDMQVCVNDSHH